MIKNIFIYLIILYGDLILYTTSEVRIPFGIINENNNNSELFIDKITQNQIYTNISFGTPPQLIKLYLKINYQVFYLPSNLINANNSKTMNCTSIYELSIDFETVQNGYYCTDIIYLNNIEKKINFILNGKNGDNFGSIGLLLPQGYINDIYPFFQSLYKNNAINSVTWTLKYFKNISLIDTINGNKPIGELIFGDEPHKYEKNKNIYSYDNYHTANPISLKGIIFWDLEFNDIYLILKNNTIKYFEGIKKVEINPEANYLVGPSEYFNTINEVFFNKYLDENICKEEKIESKPYKYISCDKEKFNFNDFPKLILENKLLENKFNLTGDDLFVLDPKTNKYIFLVFSYINSLLYWKLGSPFLKNHQLIFNEDAKTIGYYVSNINDSEEEENPKDSKIKYIVIICVLVLIIIGIFSILALLIKKGIIQLPRKRRANELDENIIYEEKGLNKNNDDIGNINSETND